MAAFLLKLTGDDAAKKSKNKQIQDMKEILEPLFTECCDKMNECLAKGWRLREAGKKMTQKEIAEETPAFPVPDDEYEE
jgi:hypothetical protein